MKYSFVKFDYHYHNINKTEVKICKSAIIDILI